MPELPEVETVRRGLAPAMEGARIVKADVRRADLRFPFPERFARRLTGRRIVSLARRAKYILADLDDGNVLVMHLGMSGSFRVEEGDSNATPGRFHHERSALAAHDHVVLDLEGPNGRHRITYNDPRRFGYMTLVPRQGLEAHKLFAGLGIEPLGNALDGAHLSSLFKGKAAPLKAALLDQRMIAGLGNIYVCEALWQAKLSPVRAAGSLTRMKANLLAGAIRDVLERAIEAGGSTLRDHRLADGSLGYFQHSFCVYDREGEPCPRSSCKGVIARMVQSGRSTFHCPVCQR
jgi:formamidopyrimidine-DNA glycosylase